MTTVGTHEWYVEQLLLKELKRVENDQPILCESCGNVFTLNCDSMIECKTCKIVLNT